MALAQSYRWVMEAAGQPLVKVPFDPQPLATNEVLVEVAGCGVCHTDLGFYYDGVRTRHALPLTLGHEISGRVVDAGRAARTWVGRAVIVASVIPCDACDACRRGKPAICIQQKMPGNDVHGGFASHIVVPVHGLCPVDEPRLARTGLSLADVSVIADAVTTPYHAVMRAEIGAGDLAIVVGVGGVGAHAVQVAAALGATVIALDVDAGKLERIGTSGAALTINVRTQQTRELKARIGEFASGHGLRATEWSIFECSGTAAGQRLAYDLLVPGATLSVVGFTREKIELRLSNLMAFDARAIGTWGCPPSLYPGALELVLEGKVKLRPFIEARALNDVNATLALAHAGGLSRRVILIPDA